MYMAWRKRMFLKQINRWWLLICIASVVLIVGATLAFAHTQQNCVTKAQFADALPLADQLADELMMLAELKGTSSQRKRLFKQSATLIRLDARLLAMSDWACKGE
jgi:hypothetical protein